MLKRLEIKIVVVILGTLLIVFAAVLLVLNLSVHQTSEKRSEDFMVSVIENDGFPFQPRGNHGEGKGAAPPPNVGPETMRAGRFFYAKIGADGGMIELNLEMMYDFPIEDAVKYISAALDSNRKKGGVGNFIYLTAEKNYGRIIVFAERSIEIGLLEQLTNASLWAAGVVSLVLAFFAAFLAKWMIAPVKNAFEKQRRFVSDASHELKTPLTIIGANIDVLQNEIGENQRLLHIKAQSERMNGLVRDLLTLAKTDEDKSNVVMNEFNLSATVLSAALEFESRAFEEGKQYSCDVADDVVRVGDEKQIRQLVGILIDNAIRYSDVNGKIRTSLRAEGKQARISVYNTGAGIPDEEREKIFERFYRRDESRSRETGGYGIGLSIAKAIVELHKGRITASGEYGVWIRFDATL